jgi:hypothetical protein
VFRGLAIVAVSFSLAGCQSDTVIPPVVYVTPAPVRGVIVPWQTFTLDPDVWISIELILTQKGALDITVDWAYPSSWIYVYFGMTNCDYEQLSQKACPFLISSETQTPKPRVLYTDVLDPGTYYLVFYNVPYNRQTGIGSSNTENVGLQIGLTVTASDRGSGQPIKLGPPTVVSAPRLPRP